MSVWLNTTYRLFHLLRMLPTVSRTLPPPLCPPEDFSSQPSILLDMDRVRCVHTNFRRVHLYTNLSRQSWRLHQISFESVAAPQVDRRLFTPSCRRVAGP